MFINKRQDELSLGYIEGSTIYILTIFIIPKSAQTFNERPCAQGFFKYGAHLF